MKSLSDCLAGAIVPVCRGSIIVALAFLTGLNLRAAAPPTALRIQNTGADLEQWQTFQLEWDALSNATYRVQSGNFGDTPGLNGNEMVWKTTDVITPADSVGQVTIRVTPRDAEGPGQTATFFRLLLPQPEIFSVEPAVLAPGVATDLFIVGQCFGSNDVLRINGDPQTNVVFHGSTLLARPSFTPGAPGTYVFELVVAGQVASSFNVTCADPLANPELVLQGPPAEPTAAPRRPVGRITFKAKEGATLARGLTDQIRENDNVVFEVQEGKKGLNAVNVKLARMAGGSMLGAPDKCSDGVTQDAFSGEVRLQAVDLAVEGRGLDFIWARTYHSRIGRTGAASNGWTFSYDIHLQPLGGDILIHDGTGRADRFKPNTNGVYTCPEFFREGTLTAGVFRLTFADTGYWEFNPLGSSATDGKLAKIVDRNGNTMALHYDGSGQLTQIVDDLDRTNTVAYNPDGRVASVTDFSGRTVTYQYYQGLPGETGGAGDLASATSPPVIGTPNGNDFPAGKTTTYTYSTGYLDDRENHLLLSLIDASGQTVCSYAYQHNQTDFDFLRCISIQRWTNPPAMLTYLPQTPTPGNQFAVLRCVMNDPVGNVTECFYDARNRCVKLQEFTGRATPGLPVTATVNRPTGQVRSSDPVYYETRAEWNNDSLCTRVLMPRGDHAARVYESDFEKSTRARKRGDLRVLREVACCDQDDDGDGLIDTLVTRVEYDPRFGSSEDRYLLGLKNYDPVREYLPGDTVIYNQGLRKGWDGTIKGRIEAVGAKALPRTEVAKKMWAYFVISSTDPRGNVTTASYDASGNRVKVRFPWLDRHEETSWVRNSYGEVIGVTNAPDANGHRRYDEYAKASGFTVQRIMDAGPGGLRLTNKFERDVRGNVTRYEDARGHDWLYTWNSLDQCVRAQTPTNLTARAATDFFYDENNNLFTVSGTVRDRFDNPVLDQVNRFRYDALHRLTRVECAVDATRAMTNDFVYDGNDQLVLLRGGDAVSGADPHQTISYQPDERGLLFREIAASGSAAQSTTQYDYDPNGHLTRLSEGLEDTPSVTTIEYDGLAGFGAGSDKNEFTDLASREFQIPEKMVMEKELDFVSHKTKKVATYDVQPAIARPSKITDPMGNVSTFNYDANANLKVVRHFGQTNDVAGTNGNLRLAESHYDYDALNRPIRARDLFFDISTQAPSGDGERTTTFTYAPNGQCTSVTDDLGRATTFAYDTAGRGTNVTGPNQRTSFAILLDAGGRATNCVQTDRSDLPGPPQVFAWTNVFDSLGRCVSTMDNVGNNKNWDFDSLSRVVSTTDARGNHTFYEYDLLDRPTLAIHDLDGDGVPELSTDYSERATWSTSNGRLLATTDSHDNITSYAYDSLGRCTNITHADGTQRKLVWSPKSNLIQETDANGTVASHTYDLNDRCISNHYSPGPIVATTTTFETFAYDGCSRLVLASNDVSQNGFEYNSLGDVPGNHRDGWNVLSAFDSVGNRTSLTYPGGRALTYAYDALNRCTNILESGASLASFEYDGPGRVARISYGNGMRTRILYNGIAGTQNAPDDFGWGGISAVNHALAGGSPRIASVNLKWDRNRNKTARADAIFDPAIPRTNTMTLTYDNADRLVDSLVTSDGALVGFATYGLDRMGNRTNVNRPFCAGDYSRDGLFPGPLDFQMNQYTTTPCDARAYDENGNLTSVNAGPGSLVSYSYDCHNRLVAVNDSGAPVAIYTYDALGRRISKTVFDSGGLPPLTTEFIYDGASVIEERENGLLTASFVLDASRSLDDGVIKTFTWTQTGGPLAMRRNGQDYYFHPDDQGNVLALTTTGGAVAERYDYDDYGKVTFLTSDGIPASTASSIVGNPYCWNGLRLDVETGLVHNGGGDYYEPQTGRFVDDRYVLRAGIPLKFSANNPWSGGGGGGGGVFAIESRDTLKTYFETGDIPTQNQRILSRTILKSFFQAGDKPTAAQFAALIDSMVNISDDRYLLGLRSGAMKKGTVKFFNEAKGFGLTRLLESIQDESKGFSSLIR